MVVFYGEIGISAMLRIGYLLFIGLSIGAYWAWSQSPRNVVMSGGAPAVIIDRIGIDLASENEPEQKVYAPINSDFSARSSESANVGQSIHSDTRPSSVVSKSVVFNIGPPVDVDDPSTWQSETSVVVNIGPQVDADDPLTWPSSRGSVVNIGEYIDADDPSTHRLLSTNTIINLGEFIDVDEPSTWPVRSGKVVNIGADLDADLDADLQY